MAHLALNPQQQGKTSMRAANSTYTFFHGVSSDARCLGLQSCGTEPTATFIRQVAEVSYELICHVKFHLVLNSSVKYLSHNLTSFPDDIY
jgi:hypothetical protein